MISRARRSKKRNTSLLFHRSVCAYPDVWWYCFCSGVVHFNVLMYLVSTYKYYEWWRWSLGFQRRAHWEMWIFIRGFCAEQGSSRSGVLGEVTVNLGEFASYSAPQQRALPLRNCTTGTVLHVSLAHSFILSKWLCRTSPYRQHYKSFLDLLSLVSSQTYIIDLCTLTFDLQVNVTCLTARTTERCNLLLLYYSYFDAC